MARKNLRAVAPDEPPAAPMTITEAASAGDSLALLRGMRDRIAAAIQDEACSTRDLASLSKRLMEIAREIEAQEARDEEEATLSAHVSDGKFDAAAI